MNDKFKNKEEFVVHFMNIGLQKSAIAFSDFICVPINIKIEPALVVNYKKTLSFFHGKSGPVDVLTTQLIGEISGSNYFVLNELEKKRILSSSTNWAFMNGDEGLNNALLVEIANIISASTIIEIANALELEIYGDVPILSKMDYNTLENIINDGFLMDNSDDTNQESAMVFQTTFTIDIKGQILPQFIWKLDGRIFDRVSDIF